MSDAIFWSNQWEDKILFNHGSIRSGGVAICVNQCAVKVVTFNADEDDHLLAVVLNVEGAFFILMNICGYDNSNQNKLLLLKVTYDISECKDLYLGIAGDFNLTPDNWFDIGVLYVWKGRNTDLSQFSWVKHNDSCIQSRFVVSNT